MRRLISDPYGTAPTIHTRRDSDISYIRWTTHPFAHHFTQAMRGMHDHDRIDPFINS
jgi:hypothetical protein